MGTRREFVNQAAALTVAATTVSLGSSVDAASPVAMPGTMRTYKIPRTDLEVSRVAGGVEKLGGGWNKEPIDAAARDDAERVVKAAYENGITLFDMSDIYGYGKVETLFGDVLKRSPGLRNRIVIQTKCGVHLADQQDNPADPDQYDSSYQHLVRAVEGSLKKLSTDRLDLLLLHRPDPLVEPQEVAKAFDELHRCGKVRYFGLSNHGVAQIELLKKYVQQPLVVNQVQIGLMHPYLITEAIDFNLAGKSRIQPEYAGAAGTLDYCRLNEIQIQAWSPLGGLSLSGGETGSEEGSLPTAKATIDLLTRMSAEKRVPAYAIALAWLLRHPAGILPLIGVKNPKHVVEDCFADKVSLTRAEWYSLLQTATGLPVH
jgi:predicted oxidoreductase